MGDKVPAVFISENKLPYWNGKKETFIESLVKTNSNLPVPRWWVWEDLVRSGNVPPSYAECGA